MIQRKQTLWLALAFILLAATLKFPLYVGTFNNVPETYFPDSNTDGFSMNVFVMLIATVAAIFLYHSRRIQACIIIGVLLYWILMVYLFFGSNFKQYTSGSFTLWAILYLGIPVSFVMALIGIYKDEKLIKSVDRLR